jgi:hypothetical protein
VSFFNDSGGNIRKKSLALSLLNALCKPSSGRMNVADCFSFAFVETRCDSRLFDAGFLAGMTISDAVLPKR